MFYSYILTIVWCVCFSLLQEPIPPIELYYLTEAPSEETPSTPSRKRKAAADTSRLKKTRLNWNVNPKYCHYNTNVCENDCK